MLDEQILSLEVKLEDLELEKLSAEEKTKEVKSEIATMKRAIKTLTGLSEKLND